MARTGAPVREPRRASAGEKSPSSAMATYSRGAIIRNASALTTTDSTTTDERTAGPAGPSIARPGPPCQLRRADGRPDRHEIEKRGRGGGIRQRHDSGAEGEGSRHCAGGVSYLAGHPARLPEAPEGEEHGHEPEPEGLARRRRARASGEEGYEVADASLAGEKRRPDQPGDRGNLQRRQRVQDARADPQTRQAGSGQDPDRRERDRLLVPGARRPEDDHVRGRADGDRGGDSRVHDEKGLPAVEERGAVAEGRPQVDGEASGPGISGGELSESERPRKDQRAGRQPEPQRPPGRRQRPDQLRRRQEDADPDRMADDERGGGPDAE